jgi:hypothetical protein
VDRDVRSSDKCASSSPRRPAHGRQSVKVFRLSHCSSALWTDESGQTRSRLDMIRTSGYSALRQRPRQLAMLCGGLNRAVTCGGPVASPQPLSPIRSSPRLGHSRQYFDACGYVTLADEGIVLVSSLPFSSLFLLSLSSLLSFLFFSSLSAN